MTRPVKTGPRHETEPRDLGTLVHDVLPLRISVTLKMRCGDPPISSQALAARSAAFAVRCAEQKEYFSHIVQYSTLVFMTSHPQDAVDCLVTGLAEAPIPRARVAGRTGEAAVLVPRITNGLTERRKGLHDGLTRTITDAADESLLAGHAFYVWLEFWQRGKKKDRNQPEEKMMEYQGQSH
jgi:hypothetical protein